MHSKIADSFFGISIFLILLGAAVFSYGVVGWIYNFYVGENLVFFPFFKIVGGLIVIALGYIVIELELIRKR